MIDDIAPLLALSQTTLALAFLTFLRVGAAMAVLPAFGERSLPARVRLMLALGFTVITAPAIAPQLTPLLTNPPVTALFTEAVAGLLLGLSLRLFVMTLQIAGTLIAQSTSLAQIFGGGATDAQPAIGHLLLVAGLALAVMLDLHIRVVELMITSYTVFPPGQFIPGQDLMSWGISYVSQVFALAFTLATPFVIASLIYNVALGVINRAMPQLMVAFVGAPAITLGGLLLLFVTAPLLLETWQNGFLRLLLDPFGAR